MVTFSGSRIASHDSGRGRGRDTKGRFTKGNSGIIVDGVDEVVTQFRLMASRATPTAGLAAVASASRAAERMRNAVPIGPPTLHVLNSITADATPKRIGGAVYADAGPDPSADAGAFVGRFLEHGTVRMAPRPFVGPAGDATLPEFIEALKGIPRLW